MPLSQLEFSPLISYSLIGGGCMCNLPLKLNSHPFFPFPQNEVLNFLAYPQNIFFFIKHKKITLTL